MKNFSRPKKPLPSENNAGFRATLYNRAVLWAGYDVPMPTIQIPYPLTPRHVNWDSQFADIPGNTDKYPACFEEIREEPDTRVNILDVGCGHGGLLYALSPVFPQHHILGLEIRERTVNHTVEQILVSRWETPGAYNNISIVRANVTKHIANFVEAGSIEKMFFSFPDPKFTQCDKRRKVLTQSTLQQYVYLLKPCGRIYFISDDLYFFEETKTILLSNKSLLEWNIEEGLQDIIENSTEWGARAIRLHARVHHWVFEKANTTPVTYTPLNNAAKSYLQSIVNQKQPLERLLQQDFADKDEIISLNQILESMIVY